MARLVLTDASPVIGLSRVHGLEWLRRLFERVEMTASAADEVLEKSDDCARAVRRATDEGWLVARPTDPAGGPRPAHLGAGEWSTITAAVQHDGETLVLVDDRLARREALAVGLRVAGTAAVIGLAERRGVIPSAADVFEQLLRSDFRISPEVIRVVLDTLTGSTSRPG
jgi:predicted nucleic acid-binding protein